MYPARHLRHPTVLHLEAIRKDTMRLPPLALAMSLLPWLVIGLAVLLYLS